MTVSSGLDRQAARRRFRPSPWPRLLSLALLAAVALQYWRSAESEPPSAATAGGEFHVDYVYDGDTLLLTDGRRVRLIGVDTPETVKRDHPVEPFGPEATQFTRAMLAGGVVRLEGDAEPLDRYGRTLAYVWVGDRMLNEELLRAGLARFEPQYHYSETTKRRFRQAQEQAQAARLGIWSGPVAP